MQIKKHTFEVAKIKNHENVKCWQGFGRTLVLCYLKCKLEYNQALPNKDYAHTMLFPKHIYVYIYIQYFPEFSKYERCK